MQFICGPVRVNKALDRSIWKWLCEVIEKLGCVWAGANRFKRRPVGDTTDHYKLYFAEEGIRAGTAKEPFQEGHISFNGFVDGTHQWSHTGRLHDWLMGEHDRAIENHAIRRIEMLIGAAPFLTSFACTRARQIGIDGDHIFPRNDIQGYAIPNVLQRIFYGHYCRRASCSMKLKIQRTGYAMLDFYPWAIIQHQGILGSLRIPARDGNLPHIEGNALLGLNKR